MTSPDRRTPEQIRAEISAERSQLDAELAAFGTEVKRSGRIAGSALGALGGLLVLVRLLTRRRG
jgi:hypothetical protein